MSEYVFKMPDLGEGTVEAEIVAWHVKAGDEIREDGALVEIMTDKASVEVPAPVTGRVISVRGAPGDKIAVGSALAVFDTGIAASGEGASAGAEPAACDAPAAAPAVFSLPGAEPNETSARVMASPATRRRAREAGIDLATVQGSGPNGRILRNDLSTPPARSTSDAETTEVKIIGLRRVIAERMSESKRTIPHFAYVEEIDLTELDALKNALNAHNPNANALTYLPFVAMALMRALQEFPQCNARYDAERGVIVQHRAVHLGIATQTDEGLKVPVIRDAHALPLRDLSARIKAAAERARTNACARNELSGSTITLTSLGKLGGIASTPIINAPEVAIIGLNRAVERPMAYRGLITVRLMMNISSSFDHRFVDGHDAASLIQTVKSLIEHPATIFIPKADI